MASQVRDVYHLTTTISNHTFLLSPETRPNTLSHHPISFLLSPIQSQLHSIPCSSLPGTATAAAMVDRLIQRYGPRNPALFIACNVAVVMAWGTVMGAVRRARVNRSERGEYKVDVGKW
jgi:hypothetical protein